MEAFVVIIVIVWVLNLAAKTSKKAAQQTKSMASSGANEVESNDAAHRAGYRDQSERKAALQQKYGNRLPVQHGTRSAPAVRQGTGLHREKLKTALEMEREQPIAQPDLNTNYQTEMPDLQMRPPMMQDCIHQSIMEEVHEGIDPCHDGVRAMRSKEATDEEPLYAFSGADMARAVVMAEVLGKPGGWKARNLH